MRFANRMDRFGEGVFSMLAQMKKKKLAEGEAIVDLSIGAPNIAPAPHILKALSEACLVPDNYLYAIQDQQALLEAVSEWYARRYGVELNPETEICSLLGSQEGLAHIALSIVDEGDVSRQLPVPKVLLRSRRSHGITFSPFHALYLM